MKRRTHVLMGAAAAVPLAFGLPLPAAGVAMVSGAAGGVTPDYLDLRSDARGVLRHRGFSHSLLIGFAMSLVMWAIVTGMGPMFLTSPSAIRARADLLAVAFAAGFISHIAGDACTRGGIQPFLPFVRRRCWLLPGPLRGRSDGRIDFVARLLAISAIVGGGVLYLAR